MAHLCKLGYCCGGMRSLRTAHNSTLWGWCARKKGPQFFMVWRDFGFPFTFLESSTIFRLPSFSIVLGRREVAPIFCHVSRKRTCCTAYMVIPKEKRLLFLHLLTDNSRSWECKDIKLFIPKNSRFHDRFQNGPEKCNNAVVNSSRGKVSFNRINN